MRPHVLLVPVLFALTGCSGIESGRGLSAWLRVTPGEYTEGAMPDGKGGPNVVSTYFLSPFFTAGDVGMTFQATLDSAATAAAIGFEGDSGYWIVPAGPPTLASPKNPSIDVTLAFGEQTPPGTHALLIRAVDRSERFGPVDTETFTAYAPAPVTGKLVLSLAWDTEADLDLRAVDPSGIEIWKGRINSAPISWDGSTTDDGGQLDFDSNAACVIDGKRQEHIFWKKTPPSGHYVVRVDTFSLCGQSSATWQLEARLDGTLLGRVEGESVPSDADLPHDLGAGITALEFDVP